MSVQDTLEAKVRQTFAPSYLEIENESYKHSSGSGESHFRMLMVSELFKDKNRIDRQRSVFELLKEEMKTVHALSLRLLTPGEWNGESFNTPHCQSKK
jgi:BolA family transcriptional regulator, general stress-responsive regulator